MASSQFERQVIDGDAHADETPATAAAEGGPQQFPPSPSFQDHDRPRVRLVELPAWLQAFAASVGEPEDVEPSGTADQNQMERLVSSPPGGERPKSESEHQPSMSPPDPASSSFISEDDLPEWLRAISPEDGGGDSGNSLIGGPAAESEAIDGEITVPTVSRAWSNSKDSRGTDEATSLFAQVASQAPHAPLPNYEKSAEPSAPDLDGQPGRPPDPVDMTGEQRVGGAAMPELVMPSTETAETGTRKLALARLPMAIALVLLLIIFIAAAYLFVL